MPLAIESWLCLMPSATVRVILLCLTSAIASLLILAGTVGDSVAAANIEAADRDQAAAALISTLPAYDALSQIELEVEQIGTLLAYLDHAPPWDRDAIRFRIDQRLKFLLDEINQFALALKVSEIETSARQEFSRRLIGAVNWTLRQCLERLEQINLRIAEAREGYSEFDNSPIAAINESFVQEQLRMRFAYAAAIVAHLDARDALAVDATFAAQIETDSQQLRAEVERRIVRLAEQLVGQIRLDAATLAELRNLRAEDPLNTDLERATQAVRLKHSRSLNNLESTVDLLNRLGINSAEYRTLLLQQRGFIGVELLEREVFFSVMRQQYKRFEQMLARNGPNFIFRLVIFLLVIGAALLLARWVRKFVRFLIGGKVVQISRLASEMLVSMSWLLTFLAGLLIALSTLGVSITPLLAGFGVAGIIIGFALQDTLSNLASGAAILMYRPYDVDDHIRIAGGEGQVKKMNLVATTIHTFDNQTLVIPNNKIWGETITNFTANRVRRVDIEASFSYTEDLDRVEAVLRDIIDNYELVLKRPEAQIHIGRLGDSSVSMMVKPWVRTSDYWTALRHLTREIKRRFDAEGISIPFPQRDIHVYFEEGGSPASFQKPVPASVRPQTAPPDNAESSGQEGRTNDR